MRNQGIVRVRRRLAAMIAALAMVIGLSVVTTAPAMAAGCDGHGCVGLDPVQEGCWVTSTVSQPVSVWQNGSWVQVATVWNRYSAYCHANWSRAQLTQTGVTAGYGIYAWINDAYGDSMCYPMSGGWPPSQPTQEFCASSPYVGSLAIYTDMVDGTATTVAGVNVYNSSGGFVVQGQAPQ